MSSTVRTRSSHVVAAAGGGRSITWLARIGLTARGVVYLLIGVLAFLVARGAHAEVDQKGALAQVIARPYGGWLVGLLAVGFACYALWRLSEAALGVTGEDDGAGARLRSLGRGVVYGGLAYTSVSLLMGSRASQSTQQTGYAAQAMAHPGGRILVGVVGAGIVLTGLLMAYQGLTMKFMREFRTSSLNAGARRTVRLLGFVGTIARGLVFAVAGVLVVVAAWTYDAAKASGLDGALKTLRDRPDGGLVLGLAALGLAMFGVYGLAEARYRRV
jgi:hypothetical protein